MGGYDTNPFEEDNDSDCYKDALQGDKVERPTESPSLHDEAADADDPIHKEEKKEAKDKEVDSLSRDLRYFLRWQSVCAFWFIGAGFFRNTSEMIAVVLVDTVVVVVYWAYRRKSLIKERLGRAEDAAVIELREFLGTPQKTQERATSTRDHVAASPDAELIACKVEVCAEGCAVDTRDYIAAHQAAKKKKKENEKRHAKFIERLRFVLCVWGFVTCVGMEYNKHQGSPLFMVSTCLLYFVFFVNGYRKPTILYAGLFEAWLSILIAENKFNAVTFDIAVTMLVVAGCRLGRMVRDLCHALEFGSEDGRMWSLVWTGTKLVMTGAFGVGRGDDETLLLADCQRAQSLFLGAQASALAKLSEKRGFIEKLKKELKREPSGALIDFLASRVSVDNGSHNVLTNVWVIEHHLLYSKKGDAFYEFAKEMYDGAVKERRKKEKE